jgi:hypothetical protein
MTDQPQPPIVRDTTPEPEYSPPTLIELGTLQELTQGGPGTPINDALEGHS